LSERHSQIAGLGVSDCFEMAKILCEAYKSGEYGSVRLVYTEFVSMLSQQPHVLPILPISDLDDDGVDEPIKNLILYEPDSIAVFDAIVPEYVAGVIYGAVCDSMASEQAARRTAMESATSNAEEMIDTLNLSYNRARQASITQEITEIVGGAEGL
ncbi:MAG: F0F1 ATP synthase subunit gamma, partial [Lachnospiraceae bacterium]|nr:F0F1 ATP synthase subunit gamma [Lachnospiraceae bacterium]